jgi:hypothetical protein
MRPGNVSAATLSNDVHMPDTNTSASATKPPPGDGGVLGNLPRTRPQRSSARRAAARSAAGGPPRARKPAQAKGAKAATVKSPSDRRAKSPAKAKATQKRATEPVAQSPAATTSKSTTTTTRPSSAVRAKRARAAKRAATPRPAIPLQEPAPRQGFECESETDGAVQPPGGAELVASAAEIVGELAKAGLSTGERLLKDVFSRLPLS